MQGGWVWESEWKEEVRLRPAGPGRGTVVVSGIGAQVVLVQEVVGLRVVEAARGSPDVAREDGAGTGTGRGRGSSCERRRTALLVAAGS